MLSTLKAAIPHNPFSFHNSPKSNAPKIQTTGLYGPKRLKDNRIKSPPLEVRLLTAISALALEQADKNHGQGSGKSMQLSIRRGFSLESLLKDWGQLKALHSQLPLKRRPLSFGARWRPCQ